MLIGRAIMTDVGVEDIITVSGDTLSAGNTDADSTQSLRFVDDGDVREKKNSGSYDLISETTDWLRPSSSAPGLYEVRFTSISGDTGDFSATTSVNTWHDFSSGSWTGTVTDSTIFFGGKSVTFTIEIRLDGGSVLDSAAYTLTADRENS